MAPNRSSLDILSSPCGRYIIRRADLGTIEVDSIVHPTTRAITKTTCAPPGLEQRLLRSIGMLALIDWAYTPEKAEEYPEGLPIGQAAISPNFGLQNCKQIIHTNAPRYRSRHKNHKPLYEIQLADCYRRCLEVALETETKSIAFPCIGTEWLGWDRMEAARIGFKTIKSWFSHPLYGKGRKEMIPGPIVLLSDPKGSYWEQEIAWWTTFHDTWKDDIPPPPPPTPRTDFTTRGIRPRAEGSPSPRSHRTNRPVRRVQPHPSALPMSPERLITPERLLGPGRRGAMSSSPGRPRRPSPLSQMNVRSPERDSPPPIGAAAPTPPSIAARLEAIENGRVWVEPVPEWVVPVDDNSRWAGAVTPANPRRRRTSPRAQITVPDPQGDSPPKAKNRKRKRS